MHFIVIHLEGFQLEKLFSLCLKERIFLQNVRMKNDMECTLQLNKKDWPRFRNLAKNRYLIRIERERGLIPPIIRVLHRKSTLIGVALFLLLLLYQSSFVSEIQVYGYEHLTEAEVRDELAKAGLYEGCKKSIDLSKVEIRMFDQIQNLAWIGVTLQGNLAVVQLVEGTPETKTIDETTPCQIVALKEGYIDSILAREGKPSVVQGDFVNVGDILISGILPIDDKTYTSDPANPIMRYVHANGEVYGKTVYRFIRYQPKEDVIKNRTGKKRFGLSVTFGTKQLDTFGRHWPYEEAVCDETERMIVYRPIPIRIATKTQWEVTIERKDRTEADMEELGQKQAREAIKSEIPEDARILKKSLKFEEEENIIKVVILVEAIEQIGVQRPILPQEIRQPNHTEEGTEAIGELAD